MPAYLRLFGGLRLEADGAALSGRASQKKRLALLALLGSSTTGWLSRDKLTAYLWPEADTERARHQLASAVYELRRVLGEDFILTARDELRLNSERVMCDVNEFDQALGAGARERAIAQYAGPFLDGFFVPEAPEFEQWVDAERTRLSQAFARALEELALEKAVEGDLLRAVQWWRRLAAHDPFNSRIALGLIRALEAAGDRAGALQFARIHALRLQEQLGVEPDAEIAALVERLRTPLSEPLTRVAGPVADAARGIAHAQPPATAAVGAGGSVRHPARRWNRPIPIAAAGAIAVLTVVAVFASDQLQPTPGTKASGPAEPSAKRALPVVVLMDSPHPARVYDEETRQASGTNADILNDVLRDLPIQRVKETAGPIWHRDEEVRQLEPDLVVMHLSSFCEENCEPDRIRLRAFIEYLADSETRFLIYSRMTGDTLAMSFKAMMGNLPQRYPGLPARIHVFSLVEHGTPHWKDPATAAALKLRVKELLNLK